MVWLAGGLAFTVGADYFLILQNWHLPGVVIFCFAHVCYILRAREGKGAKMLFFVVALLLALTAYMGIKWVAILYAGLFCANITTNFIYFKSDKARLSKSNRTLFLGGLILFALCDINVLLFNLPIYFSSVSWPSWLSYTFYLIWVFYIPSQILLACSGVIRFSVSSQELSTSEKGSLI